jgi:hypothetical protein
VALCQARISTKPLWGFSSSNPYHSQSRAEQLENRVPIITVGAQGNRSDKKTFYKAHNLFGMHRFFTHIQSFQFVKMLRFG